MEIFMLIKLMFHYVVSFYIKYKQILFFQITFFIGIIQPEFILPKIAADHDPSGFSRRIFFVSPSIEFKDFDYGEKISVESYNIFSRIWSVIVNDEEVGKSECKYTLTE